MEREVVRLMRLEIRNIKNVAYGKIDLSTGAYRGNKKGSILGIYGQNGSGKTVVVAMVLLKCLLSGKRVPDAFEQYIRYGTEGASVEYHFHVRTEEGSYHVEYEVGLSKGPDRGIVIDR